MNLQQIVKQLQMNLPSIGQAEVFYYLNIAYKKIVTQDVSDFIFLNHDDTNFPYPILGVSAPAIFEEGTYNTWYESWDNSLLTDKSYNVNESLMNTNAEIITLTFESIPIVCRKVISVFAFYNSSTMSDFQSMYKPFQLDSELYNKYSFVKVPFKSIDLTESSPAKIQFFTDITKIESPIFVELFFSPPDITSVYSPCLLDLNKWGIDLVSGAKAYYQADINGREDMRMLYEQNINVKIAPSKNRNNNDMSIRYPTRI